MSAKPRVWCNFIVKTKGGSELKLRIQDAPSNRLDDVSYMFATHFASGETFHKMAGVTKSKEAIEDCAQFYKKLITEDATSVVICCPDDGTESDAPGDIISAGLMTIERKGDPELDIDFKSLVTTKQMKRLLDLMLPIFEMYNALKALNLESLYDDRGVVVHPNYRGLGIAQKMFHVRRMICKEEGIPYTGALMTGFGSQTAAERDGWETVFEITYEELGKLHDLHFEGVPKTCKYMLAKSL